MPLVGRLKLSLKLRLGTHSLKRRQSWNISVWLCVSASGGAVQPLCILPLKTLPHLDPSILDYYFYSGQQNRFIDNDIWFVWVRDVFIPHIQNIHTILNKPNALALLIFDSHSTCNEEEAKKLFAANNIHVLILPAHSSTVLQPLDLSVNVEFKRLLRLHFLPLEGEDKPTKCNKLLFTSVGCLEVALTGFHIQNGFKRAGIFPFSEGAPLDSSLVRDATLEKDFKSPAKRTRGPKIAGSFLVGGPDAPLMLAHQSSPPASTAVLQPLQIVPLNPPPQITPPHIPINSIDHFVKL